VGRTVLFPVDRRACTLLSATMSQRFPISSYLETCGRQEFASAPETDDNRSLINSPDTVTVSYEIIFMWSCCVTGPLRSWHGERMTVLSFFLVSIIESVLHNNIHLTIHNLTYSQSIYNNTVRCVCNIVIYWTTERIYPRQAFLES
jgi:hypothetical protein